MHADVVIVGAGIIGCASAHELARRGRTPLIVDDRPPGEGASGRAAGGMLIPYVEAHDAGPLQDLGVRSLAMFDEFVSQIRQDASGDIEYTRAGSLQIALDDDQAAALRLNAATLKRDGVDAAWLDRSGARALEPTLAEDIVGGLHIRNHGIVAAGPLTLAVARAARVRGADFLAARATRIGWSGDRVLVHTTTDVIETEAAVLAAGAWSGQVEVEGDAPAPVRPVRGQLMAMTKPGAPIEHILWGPRCFLIPSHDGTLLAGAMIEDAGSDEYATVAAVRDLLDAACEMVPELWRAAFRHTRVGLRATTPDGLPVIGRSPALPHVIYATGYFRNGILLAPITAKFVADAVEGTAEDSLVVACSPSRFAQGVQQHP